MAASSSKRARLNRRKTIPNNCVAEYNIPIEALLNHDFDSFVKNDYSPALGLFASLIADTSLYIWEPTTGKIVAEFPFRNPQIYSGIWDMMFLPGNRIGICVKKFQWETIDIGSVYILTLRENRKLRANRGYHRRFSLDIFEIKHAVHYVGQPRAIDVTPGTKNLIVVGAEGFDISEIVMDWEDLKVLSSKVIYRSGMAYFIEVPVIHCSSENDFFFSTGIMSGITCLKRANSLSDVREVSYIDSYMLSGKEHQLPYVEDIEYDGSNMIVVAPGGRIILLEAATNGCEAHLISKKTEDVGPIRVNHKGQLMVNINERNILKIYDYRVQTTPSSLQDLCRESVRVTLRSDFITKVDDLPISHVMKDYLLYQ